MGFDSGSVAFRRFAVVGEVSGDPRMKCRHRVGEGIVDRDLMPGDGKHLRNAVAHEAGTDDRDSWDVARQKRTPQRSP